MINDIKTVALKLFVIGNTLGGVVVLSCVLFVYSYFFAAAISVVAFLVLSAVGLIIYDKFKDLSEQEEALLQEAENKKEDCKVDKAKLKEVIADYQSRKNKLDNDAKLNAEKHQHLVDKMHEKEIRLRNVLSMSKPLSDFAPLYQLSLKYIFDDVEAYFGKNGIESERNAIADFRIKYNKCLRENQELKYKFRLLEMIRPDVADPLKDEEERNIMYECLLPERGSIHYWIKGLNYKQLDEIGQEQLAVEQYMASKKRTLWEYGSDYEKYIGEGYRKCGYDVSFNGISYGIHDMGRDIIAKKGDVTYVIQCKYWRKQYFVTESFIMQIYGSAKEYEATHPKEKVVAAFYSTTRFTPKALQVAETLGVACKVKEIGNSFPCILCNINSRGEKIYHLPFERDASLTKIYKKGEFYASTVQEARGKGFRRAYKRIP
jgi:hypothetical protein